jgi:hypothetical protein
MKKLILFALTLTIFSFAPAPAVYAASPQPVAEVADELHPPNEVARELHPDRYKGHAGGGDPSRIPDYGRTPTY